MRNDPKHDKGKEDGSMTKSQRIVLAISNPFGNHPAIHSMQKTKLRAGLLFLISLFAFSGGAFASVSATAASETYRGVRYTLELERDATAHLADRRTVPDGVRILQQRS